jgi:hypothetical protein
VIGDSRDTVIAALRDPSATLAYGLPAWESLIAQARSAGVLGRLAARLQKTDAFESIPLAPRAHLVSALAQAEAQRSGVKREIEHLRVALAEIDCDVVLLKGSAYLASGLAAAEGRMFNDIDILVPRSELNRVEAALMLHGWATTHLDAYDQRYYREWTHELPPMRHVTRGTTVDVHHAILPLTARRRPDSRKLLAAAQVIDGEPRFRRLAPADMVLHSATHLFHNEELGDGLRDLTDLDALLREFGQSGNFWSRLVDRGVELDLALPLHYALRYATRILGTPIPATVTDAAAHAAGGSTLMPVMDSLFTRALRPDHPGSDDRFTPIARKLLYVRAHWLRMPPFLLVRHLATKALRRDSASGDVAP